MDTSAVGLPRTDRAGEVPPVPLGYASTLPPARPARRVSAPVTALVVGIVLLTLALYALQHLMKCVMSPEGMNLRNSDEFAAAMALIGVFAGICTIAAVVFLAVGLRWLGSVPRDG